jgi:hypothetical protein
MRLVPSGTCLTQTAIFTVADSNGGQGTTGAFGIGC